MCSLFGRHFHSPIPRRAAVTLVALVALACSSLGCDIQGYEIRTAVEDGDLAKVKALLKGNPALAFSKGDNYMTPLHYAAYGGHKDVAELLLDNNVGIDIKNAGDQTPLHIASGQGHAEVVEYLLAKGANVNTRTIYGETPLHYAARFGHKDVAELLLANGAEVNPLDTGQFFEGTTPMEKARFGGTMTSWNCCVSTAAANELVSKSISGPPVLSFPVNVD
jgi:hypothetical protein